MIEACTRLPYQSEYGHGGIKKKASDLEQVNHAVLQGLAAALKRRPTVARYAFYFRRLHVACFDNDSGPYGETRRSHVLVMCDNFPENKGPTGVNMIYKSLKRSQLLLVSFPKKPVLGQVVPQVAAQSLP